MEYELLNAIEEFKKMVEKTIQENMEEMIYFNRKLKNIIMDRLFEIFQSYKAPITIRQIEDLVDTRIYPMINEYAKTKIANKSENYLGIVTDFSQGLTSEGKLLPLDESGKEIVNKVMEKYVTLSEESRRSNIDFSELYEEIIDILKRENLLNLNNFDLNQDIKKSISKTQEQTEEYYADKNDNLAKKSEAIADQIYQKYLQLINQKSLDSQNTSSQNMTGSSFN